MIAINVEDVAPNGLSVDLATVCQRKRGRPVRFELTEQTRQPVDDHIRTAGKKPGELPSLAAGPQRHGAGQTGNRGPMASQRLPALPAVAITPSGPIQDERRDP